MISSKIDPSQKRNIRAAHIIHSIAATVEKPDFVARIKHTMALLDLLYFLRITKEMDYNSINSYAKRING